MKDHIEKLINPKYYNFLTYLRKMSKITILHFLGLDYRNLKICFFSHYGHILSLSLRPFISTNRGKFQKMQNFKGFQKLDFFFFLGRHGSTRFEVNYQQNINHKPQTPLAFWRHYRLLKIIVITIDIVHFGEDSFLHRLRLSLARSDEQTRRKVQNTTKM